MMDPQPTSPGKNNKHVSFGDNSIYDSEKEWDSLDQEWWNVKEIEEELATHLRLVKKYGTSIEFRGLEPITEPMSRKVFRKEYSEGVVGKYKKLQKRKAKKKDEEVDIPVLLQKFASKHAQESSARAQDVAAIDARDAEVIFAQSMEDIAPLLI